MSGDELQVRLEVPFLGLTKSVRISKTAEVLATTTLLAQKVFGAACTSQHGVLFCSGGREVVFTLGAVHG